MADIIVTLNKEEELWDKASPEEIAKDWESWEIKSTLPQHIWFNSYIWICHRGAIRAYCTIKAFKLNTIPLEIATQMNIIFKSYHRFDDLGIKPIPCADNRCHRSWKYGQFRRYLPEEVQKEITIIRKRDGQEEKQELFDKDGKLLC